MSFLKCVLELNEFEVALEFVEGGRKETTLTGVEPIVLSLITLELQTATG